MLGVPSSRLSVEEGPLRHLGSEIEQSSEESCNNTSSNPSSPQIFVNVNNISVWEFPKVYFNPKNTLCAFTSFGFSRVKVASAAVRGAAATSAVTAAATAAAAATVILNKADGAGP